MSASLVVSSFAVILPTVILFPICSRFPLFFVSDIANVIYVMMCVIRVTLVIRFVTFLLCVACVIGVIRVICAAANEKQTATRRRLRLSRRAMISIKAAPFDLNSAFNFAAVLDASSHLRDCDCRLVRTSDSAQTTTKGYRVSGSLCPTSFT